MFVAFSIGSSLAWVFRAQVFLWLLAPAGGQLSESGKPIFTGPTDMFSLTISMVLKCGMIAAFPVLAYQLYALFLRPFLNKQQKRTLILFAILITFFYFGGVAFAYYVLLPAGLDFMLAFGTDTATPLIEITKYMALTLAMLFWIGVTFEIPVVMLLLSKLRLVSYKGFARVRRYVPIAAVILSAIITPTPDWVNQLLVAGPIWALYEVGVFLSWLARPKVAR